MKPIIQIENLSKKYRLGQKERENKSFLYSLVSIISYPIKNFKNLVNLSNFKNEDEDDVIWALKNINLEVYNGDVLGIVGKNGAGKSTLLKVLSQITSPTSGRIKLEGKLASLLEVGTGFHPDLTGRENIYLNGTILGLTRKDVDSRLKDIIKFSGVEKFIDTPVKRFSSGMQVRLAFAVAAHLDPDILIIDEVLAVGDQSFKEKCIGRIQDLSYDKSRTVIFVSHDLTAVQKLCNRAIFVDKGKIIDDGLPDNIIQKYLNHFDDNKTKDFEKNRRGDGLIKVENVELFDTNGNEKTNFKFGESITVKLFVKSSDVIRDVIISIAVKNYSGIEIFYSTSKSSLKSLKLNNGISKFFINIDPNYFMPGLYSIRASINYGSSLSDWVEDAIKFKIIEVPEHGRVLPDYPEVGNFYYELSWEKEN